MLDNFFNPPSFLKAIHPMKIKSVLEQVDIADSIDGGQ